MEQQFFGRGCDGEILIVSVGTVMSKEDKLVTFIDRVTILMPSSDNPNVYTRVEVEASPLFHLMQRVVHCCDEENEKHGNKK